MDVPARVGAEGDPVVQGGERRVRVEKHVFFDVVRIGEESVGFAGDWVGLLESSL